MWCYRPMANISSVDPKYVGIVHQCTADESHNFGVLLTDVLASGMICKLCGAPSKLMEVKINLGAMKNDGDNLLKSVKELEKNQATLDLAVNKALKLKELKKET